MDLLARQKAKLKQLDNSIDSLMQQSSKLKQQVRVLNQKKRYQKLTKAGLLFEKAGILDDYDADAVVDALKKLRKPKEGEADGFHEI